MYRFFKKLFVILFLISLISCEGKLFEDSKKNSSNSSSEQREPGSTVTRVNSFSEFENSFVIKVSPHEKPYVYNIDFQWIPLQTERKLRIREDKRVIEASTNLGYFRYTSTHNQNLKFYFEVLDSDNRPLQHFERVVETPSDFVVSEGSNLLPETEKTDKGSVFKYQRIFLSQTIPLVYNASSNFIEVEDLYTEGDVPNKISNWNFGANPEYKAEQGQEGLNAPNLFLKIKNLHGKIEIFNRGQDGGDGKNGENFLERASPGTNATLGIDCEPTDGVKYTDRLLNPSFESPLRWIGCRNPCDKYGVNAGDGSSGVDGRPASDGRTGGSTGNVSIKIDSITFESKYEIIESVHSEDLEFIKVINVPGVGGHKGIGGDGQLGGLGGNGYSGKCDGKPGKDGPNGKKGPDGKPGVDGIRNPYCLSIISLGINICE